MSDGADQITREIVAWAHALLPQLAVATQPLNAGAPQSGVDIRLIGLAPRQSPRTANPPITVDLDYLVTVRTDDAYAEQNALGELLFAAADRSDFEIVTARAASAICAELGIPVAAGFVIRTAMSRMRAARKVPLVREPLVVESAEIGVVEGTVLGPGDIPIADAVVSLPGIGHEARTDARGRFRIVGAPQEHGGIKLNVKARGAELNGAATPGKRVVLRLPLEV